MHYLLMLVDEMGWTKLPEAQQEQGSVAYDGCEDRPRNQREAWRAYDIAVGLERDPAVRRFLQRRQATVSA